MDTPDPYAPPKAPISVPNVDRRLSLCRGLWLTAGMVLLAVAQLPEEVAASRALSTWYGFGAALLCLVALRWLLGIRAVADPRGSARWFSRRAQNAAAGIAFATFVAFRSLDLASIALTLVCVVFDDRQTYEKWAALNGDSREQIDS